MMLTKNILLQLALSPVPRMPSEPLVSPLDSQFALKVEGVIEHGQNPGKSARQLH